MSDEKWVKIMCDYSADPVWSKTGGNGDLDALPVSFGTRVRLSEWAWFYDAFNNDYLAEKDRILDFPVEMHRDWGRRLAQQVRGELPEDWTVVFFNELNKTTDTIQPKATSK